MPLRWIIAAVLFPVISPGLFGAGLVSAALLGTTSFDVVIHCVLAALLLAVPLSLESAPLLVSPAERRRLDRWSGQR